VHFSSFINKVVRYLLDLIVLDHQIAIITKQLINQLRTR
jgi:hypothetical protein